MRQGEGREEIRGTHAARNNKISHEKGAEKERERR